MLPAQIEVGDQVLKLLNENGGASSLDQYPSALKKQGYDYYKQVGPTIITLKTLGFVESPDEYNLRLTAQGYDAAKMGLAAYFKKQEHAADLEVKEKQTSIRYTRWSFILAGAAFLHTLFPIVNLTEVFGLKPPVDVDGNSEAREDNTQGSISESRVSSETVDEIRKSLLHDSVFISELSKELQRYNNTEAPVQVKGQKPSTN